MLKKIQIKSPTRVDLAGGTLDLWPLYLFVDQACTVNLSISIYTYAELEVYDEDNLEVRICLKDLDYDETFSSYDAFSKSNHKELSLVGNIVKYFKPNFGFSLVTSSESPVGGGLGGSSSLTVSIMKAFNQAFEISCSDNDLVNIAHDIEAQVLKTPTGTQDYYPAVNPGLGIIEYSPGHVSQSTCEFDKTYIHERMFLVDTGKSHHSGINNWDVYKKVIDGCEITLQALREIKTIAEETKEVCLKKQWDQLPQIFQREQTQRLKLSDSFASAEITKLSEITGALGAEGFKICGAGGGGCVLVWCPKQKKQNIIDGVELEGFKVYDVKPVTA